MRVVPKEADTGSDHGATKYGEISDGRHSLQFQVLGQDRVSAQIGQDGQGSGRDYGAADGQAIQAVSQVDGIARTHQHQHHEQYERSKRQKPQVRIMPESVNGEVGPELLEKRDHQMRRVLARGRQQYQHQAHQARSQELQQELHPAREPQVSAVDDLDVVVGKANGSKSRGGKDRQPDIGVRQIGPQQRGNDDGYNNQNPAHGGRAGFFLVRAGTFFADVLADLELAQLADDGRPDDQPHEQRGQTGKSRAKGDVTKNAERWKMGEESLIK